MGANSQFVMLLEVRDREPGPLFSAKEVWQAVQLPSPGAPVRPALPPGLEETVRATPNMQRVARAMEADLMRI